ncbi:response regulator [Massilia sp. CCM 8734]|uniref:response regulator n=1 Tax=Massilia sp. CCM 8734 TaxID=2609283 RepID=UPI00141E214A|nr:response regulator [Massilia sp. CCM 8734]NHZ97853.1 response regulator [Massilia sp. CCM 8734]
MPSAKTIDQTSFRRILARNVALPLAIGVGSALIFVAVISYLLSVLSMVEHSEKVIGHANEAAKLSVDQESGLRGYLLSNDEAFLAPYTLSKGKAAATMEALTKLVSDNPPQVARLRQIAAMQEQWELYANNAIALRRANSDVITLVRSGRGKVAFDEIRTTFNEFLAVEQRLLKQRSDSAQSVTRWGVALYLLVSLLLSGLLAYFGRRELMRLSEVFGDAIDQHRTHGEALERQAWQRSGQTQLAERSIGHNSLPSLGRATLDFMSEYTGAAVAALYARDEDGSLRRIAGYGMSREEREREVRYNGADTLVGQTLLSKRPIVMGNLPDHYLKVTSGIGSGSPRHLVLIPLDNDGAPNGVAEFGFLNEPRKRDLEFLELVAPNIGRAIEAALARRRLHDALAETQQLNEELQVQQEELRTANEELEEQSRVLEESQTILENQKAELEQTNDRLAEQANALDEKNGALGVIQHELEERALDLQRASKYKSEFLANMSHELRTPLNSSLILSKLLSENAKGNLEPEQIQFANTIYAAGNDLLNLINDILDISKVEAGKLELTPEDIALTDLADAMRHTFAPLAGQKRLTFTSQVAAGAPLTLHSDAQRLQQILRNLLSNAIKFTDAGEVSLTIEARPDAMLAFVVRDSGIGIAADQHAIIFEAFRQADGTTSRRYGGTGLGLSISRDLAALLGGSIVIASSPGQGSTFTLLLPGALPASTPGLPQTLATTAPAAPRTSLSPAAAQAPAVRAPVFADDRGHTVATGRSVLVIEDDVTFARILFDLAHEMHYRCLVAHSAADGLQAANEFLPDAILLDLGLPDGSGLDVLQKLKDNPRARHIPVHIVSANDRAEAAMQLGAIGYVIKPATRDRLKQVFQTLEGKFTQKMKRVLLVEDDERQRESVVHLIDDADVEITAVATGEEALALLRASVYDCMIIDLKLPDMQGHDLLRKMAAEEIVSFPPVIVYTGRNLTRAEEAELLKYSRSIIIKGARSPERLLDEVTLFLHKVESQMSVERQSMLKTVRSRDRVFDGRRILLVDDDVRNIFSLTSALEQKGIIVEVGRNGFEALERLDQIADIDLVLMDVMMPGMDGLEATRRLRADPRFAKLPVIAITAKAMKDDQEQCMKAGASDYLAKPIDLDRLYSLLRVWLPSMERL